MNKFLQVSIVVVLALALVCTAFSVAGTGVGLTAGMVSPRVGWHTGAASFGSPLASLQVLAAIKTPNVGWRG